jgi:dipeptidase E
MPIVAPPTLNALNIINFQINPHYISKDSKITTMSESRDTRLNEFLEENNCPILGLPEGSYLVVKGLTINLFGGPAVFFKRGADPLELSPYSDISNLVRDFKPVFDTPLTN